MTRAKAQRILLSLFRALQEDTVLAWAVEHARDRDPVPDAWRQCRRATVMYALLGCVHRSWTRGSLRWTRLVWGPYVPRDRRATAWRRVRRHTPVLRLADFLRAAGAP